MPVQVLWDQLEEACFRFNRRHHELSGSLPPELWHYTSPEGLTGILRGRALWLTQQPSSVDPAEIRWGNELVTEVAKAALKTGGCPALRVMLDDPSATWFRREEEMFVACFTDDDTQWARRHLDGGALVFDADMAGGILRRNELGGSGMVRVQYDPDLVRRLALEHFVVTAWLAKVFPIDGSLPPVKDEQFWRSVAQWMEEPGVLSFFTKAPSWAWEREWRLVKRTGMLDKSLILDNPRRRLELPLSSECGLRKVVLGPDASSELEEEIRYLLLGWPGVVIARA